MDVLDRILDKGLVIAGDIKVSLANVELLTLQIRLLICSIDKAEQIGLNWWRYDANLTTRAERAEAENVELRERLAALEQSVRQLGGTPSQATGDERTTRTVAGRMRAATKATERPRPNKSAPARATKATKKSR